MVDLAEHLKKASKAQKDKYSSKDFSEWGKKSASNRLAHLTPAQKKEYFRKVRNGESVKDMLHAASTKDTKPQAKKKAEPVKKKSLNMTYEP